MEGSIASILMFLSVYNRLQLFLVSDQALNIVQTFFVAYLLLTYFTNILHQ